MSVRYLRNRLPNGTELLSITDEGVTINEGAIQEPALSVVRMLAEQIRNFHRQASTPLGLAAENQRLRERVEELEGQDV
jgi:hypothetical protein